MKNVMKKTVSAVSAVLMVAAVAVSAYAADYAQAPSFPSTPSNSVAVPTVTVNSTINSAINDAVSSAVDSAVDASGDSEAASGSEESKPVASVEVNSTSHLRISASAIRNVANNDAALEIVAPKATFSIDSDDISKARSINLSSTISNGRNSTTIKFDSKKDFGAEVKITLTACKMSKARLAKACLYCDGKKIGPVELDENGNPVITVSKGGKYVIK